MYTRIPMHEKMREYVMTNHLSRKIIASNMGISESRLSLMLSGKRRVTVDDFMDFCQAIAVDPRKFYESETA